MHIMKTIVIIVLMSSLARTQMNQLESPSPTPHSSGCSRYPEVSSSNSTSVVYWCIGGSGTLSAYWTVNGSSYDHIDIHDNDGNYVSEATVPIKLNGTSVQCCLVPAVGNDDICCTTVVNIGFTTCTTDPEQTTIPAILQTSTYYIPALPTPTPKYNDDSNIQPKEFKVGLSAAAVIVVMIVICSIVTVLIAVILFNNRKKKLKGELTSVASPSSNEHHKLETTV